MDNRSRKRGHRPDHQFQYRDNFDGGNQDQGGRRRGFQRNHGEFAGEMNQDGPRQMGHPGWREPPEKRHFLQRPPGFHPEGNPEGPGDFRPPFQSMRGRGPHHGQPRPPFDNRQTRDGPGIENSPFQPNMSQHDDMPSEPGINDGRWNEPGNPEGMDRPGFGGPRGRGRGFINHSMQRQGPPHGRGATSSSVRQPFVDSAHAQRSPAEPLMGLTWRNQPGVPPNERPDRSPDGAQNSDREDGNFGPNPTQRRGLHPLLRRGRGGALVRGGRMPAVFDGNRLPPHEDRGGAAEGKESPLNERTFAYVNEDARPTNWRENQNPKGQVESFSPNHINEQKQWPVDRAAGQGT